MLWNTYKQRTTLRTKKRRRVDVKERRAEKELKKKDLRWREQTTGKEYKGRKKTKAFMVAFMVSKKF